MSIQAMAAIKAFLLHPSSKGLPLRGRHTSVLGWLGDECQDDMSCWPSLTRIARVTKMGRRSVIRVLDELHAMRGPGFEQGLVTVVGSYKEDSGWATNLYELHIPEVPRQMRKRRALKTGVILTPVTNEQTGDKLTPLSRETGVNLTPVENLTSAKTDTKLVSKSTSHKEEQQQEQLPLLPADGGGSSETASPGEEKTPGKEATPPVSTADMPLGERLRAHGVVEKIIGHILLNGDHDHADRQLGIYETNLANGASHGAGVLVNAIVEGTEIKRVKPRRKKPVEEPKLFYCSSCDRTTGSFIGSRTQPRCISCTGEMKPVEGLGGSS